MSVRLIQPDGTVHIKWERPWRHSDFKITRFIILFRREKRLPGGETAFYGFKHITAPGHLEVRTLTYVHLLSFPSFPPPFNSKYTQSLNSLFSLVLFLYHHTHPPLLSAFVPTSLDTRGVVCKVRLANTPKENATLSLLASIPCYQYIYLCLCMHVHRYIQCSDI